MSMDKDELTQAVGEYRSAEEALRRVVSSTRRMAAASETLEGAHAVLGQAEHAVTSAAETLEQVGTSLAENGRLLGRAAATLDGFDVHALRAELAVQRKVLNGVLVVGVVGVVLAVCILVALVS